MDNRLYFEHRVTPVLQKTATNKLNQSVKGDTRSEDPFGKILEQKINNKVKFSQHAQLRLKQHNIELGNEELTKINAATQKAREKGAQESLIIFNDLALIVSIKNNTVITALDGQGLRENVFTNIDSAVII